jgi:beta-mannanase
MFGSTVNVRGTERTALDAVARQETELGRPLNLVHVYYSGAQRWPFADEVALTTNKNTPRYLFVNWKPENGSTWAQVAAGSQDVLIDRAAARIKQQLQGRPFFLTIHHEPENDLRSGRPGMEPKDYQAMFRHVVLRLRAQGVNFVSVWCMMGWHMHGERGLYSSGPTGFYPGDDVVDWIGADPYLTNGTPLMSLLNLSSSPTWPGFYTWATRTHPSKPIILAEIGISAATSAQRSAALRALPAQIAAMPAIRAVIYFNQSLNLSAKANYSFDNDPVVTAAARAAFNGPPFLQLGR